MKALVAEAPGRIALVDVPEPEPGPGEAVVAVRAALTCGTDLKLARRGHPKLPFPVRLGHEFAGVVESVGAGSTLAPGDRVTSAVSAPCGACDACRRGRTVLCATAFEEPVFGAFAPRLLLSARVVRGAARRIPEGLGFEAAALLDPLASVVRGLSRAVGPDARVVAVVGSGPIALLFTALLRREGRRVVVAGRRAGRLARHRTLGAETVDATLGIARSVRSATEGRGADVVVETSGDPGVAADAFGAVASGGTLLLFAGMARDTEVAVPAGRLHYEEVSVVGSFHYTPAEADEALRLLTAGAVPTELLVDGSRSLADWKEAFERVAAGDVMKLSLVP